MPEANPKNFRFHVDIAGEDGMTRVDMPEYPFTLHKASDAVALLYDGVEQVVTNMGKTSVTLKATDIEGFRDSLRKRTNEIENLAPLVPLKMTERQRVAMETLRGDWNNWNTLIEGETAKEVHFAEVEVSTQQTTDHMNVDQRLIPWEAVTAPPWQVLGGHVGIDLRTWRACETDDEMVQEAETFSARATKRFKGFRGHDGVYERVEIETTDRLEHVDDALKHLETLPINWGTGIFGYTKFALRTEPNDLDLAEMPDAFVSSCEVHRSPNAGPMNVGGETLVVVELAAQDTHPDEVLKRAEAASVASLNINGPYVAVELEQSRYEVRWSGGDNTDEDMYFDWLETLPFDWGSQIRGYTKFVLRTEPNNLNLLRNTL